MSLFASLSLIIWGSKNKYCLSFGFMLLGFFVVLFGFVLVDKFKKDLIDINQYINDIDIDIDEEISEEEKVYVLQQLYITQNKITKKQKKSKILFMVCGICFVLLGIFGMF